MNDIDRLIKFGISSGLSGRKFNYSSRLSVKVDITLHPIPKGWPNDTYDQFVPETSNSSKKDLEVFALIGAIVVAENDRAIANFHHEFSSILLSCHGFLLNPWIN